MEILTLIAFYLGKTTKILFELFYFFLICSFFVANCYIVRLFATEGIFETIKKLKRL